MQVTTSYEFDTDIDTFESIMIDPKVIEKQVATIPGMNSGTVGDIQDEGHLRTYTMTFVLGMKLPGASDALTLTQVCTYDRDKRTLDYDVIPNVLEKAFDLHGHVELRPDGPEKTIRDVTMDLTIHVPGLRQLLEFILKKQFAENEKTEMEVLRDEVARVNAERAADAGVSE